MHKMYVFYRLSTSLCKSAGDVDIEPIHKEINDNGKNKTTACVLIIFTI